MNQSINRSKSQYRNKIMQDHRKLVQPIQNKTTSVPSQPLLQAYHILTINNDPLTLTRTYFATVILIANVLSELITPSTDHKTSASPAWPGNGHVQTWMRCQ